MRLEEVNTEVLASVGVIISYLAPYRNSDALAIAKESDMKIENLLRDSAI